MESLKSDTALDAVYRIVPATVRDVHAIRRLEQVVFPVDAYTYLSLTSLLLWPGGANFKAVTGDDDLVGFVAGSPNWGTRIDWIITLGIHPDHQHRGLGRRLLSICEDNLTLPALRLTVRVSNQTAFNLYTSVGYKQVYVETRYYSDGEDGIVMEKRKEQTE